MKLIVAIVILCGPFLHAQGKAFDFKTRVGVVDVNESGKACLIISNAGLSNGLQVTLIVLANRQSVVKARIKEKLSKSCSYNPDTGEVSFYSLEFGSSNTAFEKNEKQAAAIAVVSASRVVVQNAKAGVDLDNDGRREFFRDCTSNEGLHLTVWSGKPLIGKRRWHYYYYLGYDVIPSCKRKDFM